MVVSLLIVSMQGNDPCVMRTLTVPSGKIVVSVVPAPHNLDQMKGLGRGTPIESFGVGASTLGADPHPAVRMSNNSFRMSPHGRGMLEPKPPLFHA